MLNRFPKSDLQYLLPVLLMCIFFACTNILNIFDKLELAYFSGGITKEPYRIITSHFVHADFEHLLMNIGGILISRLLLKEIGLKGNFFFAFLTFVLIPLQVSLQYLCDLYILQNHMSFLIGFSGILYGIDSFILWASIFGKRRFFGLKIDFTKNTKVKDMTLVITSLGFLWSLFPRISFTGHLTGFIAGSILFLF